MAHNPVREGGLGAVPAASAHGVPVAGSNRSAGAAVPGPDFYTGCKAKAGCKNRPVKGLTVCGAHGGRKSDG